MPETLRFKTACVIISLLQNLSIMLRHCNRFTKDDWDNDDGKLPNCDLAGTRLDRCVNKDSYTLTAGLKRLCGLYETSDQLNTIV